MPKVLNRYFDKIPKDAVYIGRGSIYGNTYVIGTRLTRIEAIHLCKLTLIGTKCTREQSIKLYIKCIIPKITKEQWKKLRGRDLSCYCKPLLCHGDPLLEIANRKKRND